MDDTPQRKSRRDLTGEAFDQLLASLDADRERAGHEYEGVRRKLLKFFEWRGSDAPEEHADETINRVARKLAAGERIDNLNGYFLGVARLLFKEVLRGRDRERAALHQLQIQTPAHAEEADIDDAAERRRECLENCLRALSADERALISGYYEHDADSRIRHRRELAAALRIPLNALRIRAHRIRAGLEACVRQCVGREGAVE